MKEYCDGFPSYYVERFDLPTGRQRSLKKFLELKVENTLRRSAAVQHALEREAWGFAWIRLQEPDDILHVAGDAVFSGNAKVIRVFRIIDDLIATSQTLADLVVLVSDHGFRKYTSVVNVNTLLHRHNLASPTTGLGLEEDWKKIQGGHASHGAPVPRSVLRTYAWVNSHIPLVRRLHIADRIGNLTKRKFESPRVDPLSSKAFLPTPYSCGVFVKDARYVETTRELLASCRGIERVAPRENVYWGDCVGRAPHLMVFPDFRRGYRLASNKITASIHEQTSVWDHDPEGIVVFMGRDVKQRELGVVNSWDVTPTILSFMGVPIPSDADGRVLHITAPNPVESRYDYTTEWRSLKGER
jgi:predicted AlkP superfamily phosphohydrolase/phosphomutase